MPRGLEITYCSAHLYTYNQHANLYFSSIGKVDIRPTNARQNHFLAGYRGRLSNAWSPNARAKHPAPISNQPQQIFLSNIGLPPHYGGHVPGRKYRYGDTFSNDSKYVKVWMAAIKSH